MSVEKTGDFLFPNIEKTISYYEEKYPNRDLTSKNIVTRFAPSPTGFVHVGSLFSAFIASMFAKQSEGVFFLRIEDTDLKRKVAGTQEGILKDLSDFGIDFDEGPNKSNQIYGPFIQSQRKQIYLAFIKEMLNQDLAYPCFCSEKDLETIRENQEINKEHTGYYGKWARCRDLSLEQIKKKVDEGIEYTIRLKSQGSFNKRIDHVDLVKGSVSFPENFLDIVILKTNKLPTYHFAHLVDDYLMRTTHIIRGDEWLSSVPIHLQLFDTLGFKRPKYAHFAPILKNDEGKKRKLSKRLDKEASISYYHEIGIPKEVLKIYLATLANTNFEEWYNLKNDAQIIDFNFSFKKMNTSGALFDKEKLNNISRVYFSRLSAEKLYDDSLEYFLEYDDYFYQIIKKDKQKMLNILNIERNIKKPRKDISCFSDIRDLNWYFFDEIYNKKNTENLYKDLILNNKYDLDLIEQYFNNVYKIEEKQEWFNRVKDFVSKNGYAESNKDYKENPDKYKGTVGDFCESLRHVLTGETKTPDLHKVIEVISKKSILERIEKFKNVYIKINK